MARRLRSTIVLICLALAVPEAAVAAGGGRSTSVSWRTSLPRGAGERVVGGVELLFRSIERAERVFEENDVHIYLDPSYEIVRSGPGEGRPAGLSSAAIEVGAVTMLRRSANLVYARVALEVPAVPRGFYTVVMCPGDCRLLLANVVPTRIQIAESATEGLLTRRLARVRRESARRLERGLAVLSRSKASQERVAALEGSLARLSARVTALADEVPSEPDAAAGVPPLLVAGAGTGGILLGALARRRRAAPRARPL